MIAMDESNLTDADLLGEEESLPIPALGRIMHEVFRGKVPGAMVHQFSPPDLPDDEIEPLPVTFTVERGNGKTMVDALAEFEEHLRDIQERDRKGHLVWLRANGSRRA